VFGESVSRRRYRLGKRAETASGTRQRIIEATLSLHDAQGITGTSVRAIAGRAGVAPATVLQHFPRMDELIRACGELTDQMAPMPTDAVLVGATTVHERIRRVAAALFERWEQLGDGFDHLRIDRRHIRPVEVWFGEMSNRHRELAEAALADADASAVDLLVAVTTVDAWRVLRDSGLDPTSAAGQIARLFSPFPKPREVYH
jgi:AcrR family transcriptional regulator